MTHNRTSNLKEKNAVYQDIYADRIMVPVSNPRTAMQLLRFAVGLAHPEKGKVKAVFITIPDTPYTDAKEQITKIVQTLQSQNLPIELVSISAPNVARGVLDAAREQNADLVVLGFQAPKDGNIVIGPVTEDVARVAPIDLIVYRHMLDADLTRVVVPITENIEDTKIALLHGAHIANYHNVPLVALYIETNEPTPFWRTDAPLPISRQLSMVHQALADTPYHHHVAHKVIEADDFVGGIVQGTSASDIVILTVQRPKNVEEKWLFGVRAQKTLRLGHGSLALIKRSDLDNDQPFLWRLGRLIERYAPTLTLSERTEVITQGSDLVRANTNFLVMIFLSSILASVGLLQSSAAVIIGAMLVAPLMSPLMGFGVGLALGEATMLRRSVLTVMQGVLIVLVVSGLLGLIAASPLPTAEMLARGEPTFLDMIVALASGAAGAFALGRKDVPAALAGVAIAAALVPPICTTGLALALGQFDLAIGAGMLSLVNIICISVASAGVFAAMGVRKTNGVSIRNRIIFSTLLLLMLGLPMGYFLNLASAQNQLRYETERVLEARIEDSEVVDIDIDGERVIVTLRTPRSISTPELLAAERQIEANIKRKITLQIVVLNVIELKNLE